MQSKFAQLQVAPLELGLNLVQANTGVRDLHSNTKQSKRVWNSQEPNLVAMETVSYAAV